MLYRINNGQVAYGSDTVLEEINFEIKEREKIALVGRNGCGKTTLLKVITGEIPLDEGTGEDRLCENRTDSVIGYMKQNAFDDDSVTLLDEIKKVYRDMIDLENGIATLQKKMETDQSESVIADYSKKCERFEFLGGYYYKKEYEAGIKKFGFSEEDKSKKLCEFSGGQRTKIALLKLVLSKPDILLLDEPTNHLDAPAIEWLQEYLRSYKKSLVVVSHDRMFLDKIVNVVYEIEYGVTTRYSGNYTAFSMQKRANFEKQLKDHDAQQKEIARLMRIVERFKYKPTKASMALSKLKAVERMKKIDAPNPYDTKSFHTSFEPKEESVKLVLTTKNLSFGYGKELGNVSLEVLRGDRLGVIGANGTGKSTLLKTLVGVIPKLGGIFEFGTRVQVGYFDQQMAQTVSEKTVFDEFYDEFPSMKETEVRTALGAFQFSGEDVFKTVSSLSGGEKVRLALCKIMRRRPNLLVLDEPTNHMDIIGKESLERMLSEYAGTVIFVSHDRYFTNKIANKLLVFDSGRTEFFNCGYEEYCETVKSQEITPQLTQNPIGNQAADKPKNTCVNPLKEISRRELRCKTLERKTNEISFAINEKISLLESPEVFSDYVKVSALQSEIDGLKSELDVLETEYVTLLDEIEEIKSRS